MIPAIAAYWNRSGSLSAMLERLRAFSLLPERITACRTRMEHDGAADPNAVISEGTRNHVAQQFQEWRRLFENHGLTHSEHTAMRFEQDVRTLSYRQVIDRLDGLLKDFADDCTDRRVEVVPADKTRFLGSDERGATFGAAVENTFPQATKEIREAGRCLALGLNTASVFHLMRAVEYALRALLVAAGETGPNIPLEYQEWGRLITTLEDRLRVVDTWGPPEWAIAREFLAPTLAELKAFKDEVRNVVAHARDQAPYSDSGARGVRDRVEQMFMRLERYKIGEDRSVKITERATFTPR
jgi:hypothetical protein